MCAGKAARRARSRCPRRAKALRQDPQGGEVVRVKKKLCVLCASAVREPWVRISLTRSARDVRLVLA